MKSFLFSSGANENAVAPEIKTWSNGAQHFWLYESTNGTSTINIQGYKNINIHCIEAIGNVSTLISAGIPSSVIVNDWRMLVQINGQNPLVGSNIVASPNGFSISTTGVNPVISLGKYNPKISFADPVTSATSIQLTGFQVSGIGPESLTDINLSWLIGFMVYYTFEGE
jgi:hypothetical protein